MSLLARNFYNSTVHQDFSVLIEQALKLFPEHLAFFKDWSWSRENATDFANFASEFLRQSVFWHHKTDIDRPAYLHWPSSKNDRLEVMFRFTFGEGKTGQVLRMWTSRQYASFMFPMIDYTEELQIAAKKLAEVGWTLEIE